ncbi:MAG TPA: DUF4105 domain-containing protein [Xanthomonadaceae bacterium]|nr:DUF4105 domain-containing protein [Xanthomonadaceae bacterium]
MRTTDAGDIQRRPSPSPARGGRPGWARARFIALIALCVLLLAGAAQATPRIGVMTMLPGEIFWERFGHDAIVVDDPAAGAPVSYNFGFFDPSEPDFVSRFVHGHMRYRLVALPLADDLAYYREVGRGVSIQWLDMAPAQAQSLADALAENALPRNARYDYDYFTDNCSTRVRDALDHALGGQLHEQLAGRSRGNTYRGEAVRLASPAPWMSLGFDVGLGPFADTPLSRWEEAFVPMHLADSLREVRLADGRPLVRAEARLLPHRVAPEPAERARPWWPWLLAGLAAGIALLAAGARAPRAVAAFALACWTLAGLLGALLLFLWIDTAHRAAWANQNLLLFDPLCLLLLPGGWRLVRGRAAGPWFGRLLVAVLAAAGFAWFMRWLPAFPYQDNARWIALLLPVHAALCLRLRPRA